MTKRAWKDTIVSLIYDLISRLEEIHSLAEYESYQKILDSTYAEILKLTAFSNAEIPEKHWNSLRGFALERLNIQRLADDVASKLGSVLGIDGLQTYQKILDSTYVEILELTAFSSAEIPSKQWFPMTNYAFNRVYYKEYNAARMALKEAPTDSLEAVFL